MEPSINTNYAVIVLGDEATVSHFDLTERAALQGATVCATYSFVTGEPAAHDDLTEVETVVAALSRAIETRTDVWMPFAMEDLGREQHVRRFSLVLQRHGLNLLMGHDLEPCTMDGGFSPIDFALRAEVKAVDQLGFAALANAALRTLGAEIETELTKADRPVRPAPAVTCIPRRDEAEKTYSAAEAARFFGRPVQWIYAGFRSGMFNRLDGSRIETVPAGKGRRRRFTLPMLRSMALSCHLRGGIDECELLDLLAVLARAEEE